MTVLLSVVSFPLAIAIGIGVAIGRLYGPWIVAKPLGLYVEVLRGTPLMLQLYAIFFLLPKIGLGAAGAGGGDRRAGDQLFGVRSGDLSGRLASDSARADGSGAGAWG